MDHFSCQKYKNNQFKNRILDLENNFKSIKIMDKFEKKELTKKRKYTKNIWFGVVGMIGELTIFLSL